jgi:nitrite reductase/ring-hydroxylating ferredoxin subunit
MARPRKRVNEDTWIIVATLTELREARVKVVAGHDRRIAVFADGDAVYAVENNCPHMGFPLDRGAVADGILTCHWHQARFDLRSGCTFDLWADDVLRYATRIDEGVVRVAATPSTVLNSDYHRARLRRGIELNVRLVQAKSLLALLEAGAPLAAIAGEVVSYACNNLNGFAEGLTRLGCIINLYPDLRRDTAYQGLYYAVRRIAEETNESLPRRPRQPLGGGAAHDLATLLPWLRQWVQTRHRDGAERTVLTGIENLDAADLATLVFTGAAERMYANGGHLFEDANKAFELLALLGDDSARAVFPLLIPGMTGARGQEESTNWHHPVEIVAPLRALEEELPRLLDRPRDAAWLGGPEFVPTLLGDDPLAIIAVLTDALGAGAPPRRLAQLVSYAAALRLARFATSNEVTDWFAPQHTFIYSNGVYQALGRTQAHAVVKAAFHGAISVYMDRYLNVPPARLPGERGTLDGLPTDGRALCRQLLDELDQRSNIEAAAALVARYLRLDHPLPALIDTLTQATVREDLDFHSLQVLDAGVNQSRAWGPGPEREHILIGVVRNLAAHCPTRRAGAQTATIAARLHRGERIYEA